MRPFLVPAVTILVMLSPLALGLTPQEYEDLGQESAESGDYFLAAQHYAKAADAYVDAGNYSAAAVNYERAASFYASVGSASDYYDQAQKAASAYAEAGEYFLSEGNYWFAANAFSRGSALHNATGDASEYIRLQLKSGDTYLIAAVEAGNQSQTIRAIYRATLAYFGLDRDRFARARDQLDVAVDEFKQAALKSGNLLVFDILELYYLPLFTQVLADEQLAAQEMKDVGSLASQMGEPAIAASYYTSAAILHSDAGQRSQANATLLMAANAYADEMALHGYLDYDSYLYLKGYFEESLFILNYLGEADKAAALAQQVTANLSLLQAKLEEQGLSSRLVGSNEQAAHNYSAAAEIGYILGSEGDFERLNSISGWLNYLTAEAYEAQGEDALAAAYFEEAGILLRIARNQTDRQAYSRAAVLDGRLGDEQLVAGNLTEAAAYFARAARYFKIVGDAAASSGYYSKYMSALRRLMEEDPESRGFLLVSLGDAQLASGDQSASKETYAEASDELVEILGTYLSYPEYLVGFPSLPTNLVKAYRLSGRYYLARNTITALDFQQMYPTLSSLASTSQMYATAARIYRELASDDLSVYDFQNYAVDTLFSGLASVLAGQESRARQSLERFEAISHPLHSSNRKFHELLRNAVRWAFDGDTDALSMAMDTLGDIQSLTEGSEMDFLLQDLETFLSLDHPVSNLLERAAAEESAERWSEAGRLYHQAGLVEYFAERFSDSLSAFEDSAYSYIISGEYTRAAESSERAYEAILDPPDFVVGLLTLSQALAESNRTKAGLARATFKAALDDNYKSDRSRTLIGIARELEGVSWGVVIGQLSVGVAAALSILAAVLIIRRRATD